MPRSTSPTAGDTPAIAPVARPGCVPNPAGKAGAISAESRQDLAAFAVLPTEPVNLPVDLLADARKFHAQVQERNHAHGYKGFAFEDWLAEILRDAIYGRGFDPGAALDWIER